MKHVNWNWDDGTPEGGPPVVQPKPAPGMKFYKISYLLSDGAEDYAIFQARSAADARREFGDLFAVLRVVEVSK